MMHDLARHLHFTTLVLLAVTENATVKSKVPPVRTNSMLRFTFCRFISPYRHLGSWGKHYGADTHPLTANTGLCPEQNLGQISVGQTVRASVFVFLTFNLSASLLEYWIAKLLKIVKIDKIIMFIFFLTDKCTPFYSIK